jgi:hypothetical protein
MTADRRTIALGVAAAGAVAAAVLVAIPSHGAEASPERRAVTAYIDRVNAIQNAMQAPLSRVLIAYRDFVGQGNPAHDVRRELTAATATLTRLDRKLVAAPAPPEGRRLRTLLSTLVHGQAAVTREVQLLAVFSPRYAALLRKARTEDARLSAALKAVPVPKAHALKGTKQQVLKAQKRFRAKARASAARQADAIDTYVAAIARVAKRLARLTPPAVLKPSATAQIEAFARIRSTGAALSSELRKPQRGDVAALGRKFALSSRSAQSVAAQRAQIAAIRQYNRRARALSAAAARVQQELLRLQRDLP